MASPNVMSFSETLSFAELVQGRDSSVRVTADGLLYAVDLVMVMTGKDKNNSAQVFSPNNAFCIIGVFQS
jgi:hypothetical protein